MAKATHRETIVIVEGSTAFPLDMLRYDSCVPASESDSYAMLHDGEVRRVALRRFTVDNRAATEGRWLSFGWRVLADSSVDRDVTQYWKEQNK